jgi:dienelactone hydrolase
MSNLAPIVPNAADEPVSFVSRDGWRLEGLLRLPASSGLEPDQVGRGVVLVPGSHHERDTFVYGLALPDVLADHGIASLRFDIRGRGASRSPRSWRELTTLERRAVADDVASACALLRQRAGIGAGHLAVLGEQDTSRAVVAAVESDPHVGALVLLSPRLGRSSAQRLRTRAVPTCALVSKEDRRSLSDAVDAFLAGPADRSELHVFAGLGFGTTMFMARAFQHPDELPLEMMIATWLGRVL